ncbi:MAG: helix-turn-helix domain-containing protein [Anaerolineae bacterium]
MSYDPHNVESILNGYKVPLTPAERREVVHQLTERGWSAAEIGDHLGISPRTVQQHRKAWTPQPAEDAFTVRPRPYPENDFDDNAMRAAAARFIGAVHDGENVWEALAVMPPDDVKALAVVCAAACDPDQPINRMLAWLDQPLVVVS